MSHALTAFATADLADAFASDLRRIQLDFRDFGSVSQFAGRARTAVAVGDTRLLADQLYSAPGEGAIAVVDGGGWMETALLGDMNAERLRANGWAGIIINGVVRDVARLADIGIGIKALGATPLRSGKTGDGALDLPVAFGSVLIEPGDCLYCDKDGVLVSKRPLLL